jgi:bifunctional DNase/RNase
VLDKGAKLMIEMTIESVRINLATQQRVVILKATTQERYLFIWVAHAEAYAIAIELQGTPSPRPLTHDLIKNMLESLQARVVRVEISDIVDDIFYASIVLDVAGRELAIDARPSDGFALAVRVKAPIFVTETVLDKTGVVMDSKDMEEPNQTPTGQKQESTAEGEVVESEKGEVETEQEEIERLRRENEALRVQIRQLQDKLGGEQ